MEMFCYQCQEAVGNVACTGKKGVCGITPTTTALQELTLHLLKGISVFSSRAREEANVENAELDKFVIRALFETVTNVSFSDEQGIQRIAQALKFREEIKEAALAAGVKFQGELPGCCTWTGDESTFIDKAKGIGGQIDAPNEDVRSLRSLAIYGLKGISAYFEHAMNLGANNVELHAFVQRALASLTDDSMTVEESIDLVLETGKYGVEVMALLDGANTGAYGTPEVTEVQLGVRANPAILVSGHDLKDLEQLLEQTKGKGVDVYTHSEMLPAHAYPVFKKFDNLAGNYGDSWWQQKHDFEAFNGPVLMTTNCLVPPKDSYKDRVYTTGPVRFDGCKHIAGEAGERDFTGIIKHAKKCEPPKELESGTLVTGFAHGQILALADKVVGAVKSGAIKKFVVMGGCDGRQKAREYYTDFAQALPKDSVILTGGCAKFRYNKLELGDIDGIPRVLDAGQCNDCYSLAVVALKLKEVFELDDINDLPIVYNIAWYEQKAVIVLLSLLYLGIKNIHVGPSLPAFLTPNVAKVLVDNFGLSSIGEVSDDIETMMA